MVMNRYICGHAEQYSDEQVYLWTCRTVETLTVETVNRNENIEQVVPWTDTNMGRYLSSCGTGRSLWLNEREAWM